MRALLSFFVMAGLGMAQTAVFPGAVVTDSQLMKARNAVQTTLATGITSTSTSISIVSGSGVVAPSLMTVDSEVIAICGVVGNTLTVGKSSCPNVDGRGFDSTSAAVHSAGKTVSWFVDAWHHNAVTAEVKAVEAALGANLANVAPAGNQAANQFLAGPVTGSPAGVVYRSIAGPDLPVPGLSSLGAIFSKTCTAGQFLSALNTDGTSACGTPAGGGDVTGPGAVTNGFVPTWGASSNLLTTGFPASASPGASTLVLSNGGGTIAGGWLPTPGASTLGAIKSLTCTAGQFLSAINTDGTETCDTPAGSGNVTGPGAVTNGFVATWGASNNLLTTGLPVSATPGVSTVVLSGGGGTIASGWLPNPSGSTLGGVQSLAAVTSRFLTSITTSGVPVAAQPAFTDISGTLAGAQLPTLSGDLSNSGAVLTLATVNVGPGSCGDSTHVCVVTTNGKGLVTAQTATAITAGSVSSVGLSLPAIFSVSGSPVTSSGTLTGTLATQTANTVWAGPASGSAAAPTFRALVSLDIPNNAAITSGTAAGLTGYTIPGTATQLAVISGTIPNGNCVSMGANNNLVDSGSTGCGGGGGGTVNSVALTAPAIFSVSGSPVTTTGTLALSLATQTANTVWAGPTSGGAATPTFRTLGGSDLPNPSSSTKGGVQSAAAVSHQWINSISTSGVPALSQPAFSDISGTLAGAQLPTLSGDLTNSAAVLTLATVNSGPGACGDSTHVCAITTNGKGLVTSQTSTAIAVGAVTSVALALPNIFTVSGSPVTSSGTLTGTLATQTMNQVFAGPVSGVANTPGFRALVLADLPTGYLYVNLSGAPTLANQQVQSNTSNVTKRTNLNFDPSFTLSDSAGSDRTTVSLSTIGAGVGGTGQSTYGAGDVLVATASTTLSKINNISMSGYISAMAPTSAGGCGMAMDGTTDDTTALNNCITNAAVSNTTPVIITFPARTAIINGAVMSVDRVSLRGAGAATILPYNVGGVTPKGVTEFKYTGSSGAGTYVFRVLGGSNQVQAAHISGIHFNANNLADVGLRITAANGFNVHDVSARDSVKDAILVDGTGSSVNGGCGGGGGNAYMSDIGIYSTNDASNGLHFKGAPATSPEDVCSIYASNVTVVYSGAPGTHGIWQDNVDDNQVSHVQIQAGNWVSHVTSIGVSGGTATVNFNAAHYIPVGTTDGIYLKGINTTGCGGAVSDLAGLVGNFTATATSSTQIQFPTTAGTNTYCFGTNGVIGGAGLENGYTWNNTHIGIESTRGIHANPSSSTGSVINAQSDNIILGMVWTEACGGQNYVCMSGMMGVNVQSAQPIIASTGDFVNLTLNGSLYARDPATPTNRYAMLAPGSGGRTNINGADASFPIVFNNASASAIGSWSNAGVLNAVGGFNVNGSAFTDSSRNTTVNNLTINGTCTGCGSITAPLIFGGTPIDTPFGTNLQAIGFTSPAAAIISDGQNGVPGGYIARRANSGLGSLLSGDTIGSYSFRGYISGTGYSGTRATMFASAAENWTSGANGTQLAFQTTPVGSTTAATHLIINSAGLTVAAYSGISSRALCVTAGGLIYAATSTACP